MAAIVGESGSGKSTLARVLSMWSGRTVGGCFWMVWRCPPAEEGTPRCKEGQLDAERFGL
ncbi:MAG: hypothetical protein ACLSB9_31580 [Hydrogeniiclostridium mannosilyticum]